jgi:quinol monooxygenase YgiN
MARECETPSCLKIYLTVPGPLQDEIYAIARTQLGSVRAIPGCIDICLLESKDRPERFLWEEIWASWELLEKRIASESFHIVLEVLDMSLQPPRITISKITDQDGMQQIAAIRVRNR